MTARFTDSRERAARLGTVLGRVLADLVEHHHRVVQRVPEDRQEADDGRRRDLEAEDAVDARRDDDGRAAARCIRRERHLPGAEVDPHEDRGEHDERRPARGSPRC